jgi:multiple sugar transport system permease protein
MMRWWFGRKYNRTDVMWAFLMIAPNLLGLMFFYMWPVIQTFYFSFTEWGDFGKHHWAGLSNYETMLHDPDVWHTLRNTLLYTFLSVPISIALSIVVATLLNQKIKFVYVYRTLYFLPVVTMPAAVAMVWKWLFNSDYGLLNQLLHKLSIEGPMWLTDPMVAPFAVILVGIWSSIGYNMVIFLAGLQGISKSYYEAADLDGAGFIRKFWTITLPILSPTVFFASLISIINAFQVFDLIWMMIGDKNISLDTTQSLVYFFYEQAFVLNNEGYAAAVAMLLFALIMIVTIIQMKLQNKWVHYE